MASYLVRVPRSGLVIGVGAVSCVLAGFGNVAYAYWTSSATGSGSAVSGSAAAVTFATGAPSTTLYPGGSADVVTTVTNPNPYKVLITGITVGTITSGNPTCDAGSGVTFNVPGSYPTGTYTIPAKAGVGGSGVAAYTLTIANGASMAITSDSTCQSKTFTFPLTGTATATP